jgi:ABC-type lipoprotein release transport system permease subunit
VIAGAAALLLLVSMIATARPALTAAQTDPVALLRGARA